MRTAAVLGAVGIVLTLPAAVHAVGEPQLVGTVGPGYTIELEDSAGNPVTSLAPGTYDIVIHDLATDHNFHLSGPGVNQATTVGGTGDTTWQDLVIQANSTYMYVCDPHADFMKGSFTTGAPPPPPPPGPPPPGPPPPPPPPPPAPPPPPQVHPLQVSGVRISVVRRASKRFLLARARTNKPATARLALVRRGKTRASARKNWAAGLNRIQVGLPRPIARGRWTAILRVGTYRFKRDIRIG
jgi:hypothetical protein